MVRAVTFWYTKELSTFENNEDLPSPKIDVTRYMFHKNSVSFRAVLRIHDILVWIRIRGSMPLTNGSGFGSGYWIRILLFSSLTCKMLTKKTNLKNSFSAYYFWKVHLHYFSKIKSKKKLQTSRSQGFSYYFCMMIEGSGFAAGSGLIPITNGSGSGSRRPKNIRIRRIRIRNTAFGVSAMLYSLFMDLQHLMDLS